MTIKKGVNEMKKVLFEEPQILAIGTLSELTGQGGAYNDDGWYWSALALT